MRRIVLQDSARHTKPSIRIHQSKEGTDQTVTVENSDYTQNPAAFEKAKERIRAMEYRKTKYNDFKTH